MADTKKKNVFGKISSFFRACIGEIKKITWPTAAQTTKNFLIVLVVIIIAGLFIYGLDRGLYALLNLVMSTGAH
ncbi:preprotein translocase subunit SecE [uncultured Ruminococcus sp.]|uniref:preprotein translocase subunit SecE n=1 Tax=uncultured Ruminococcus sp. TaxID=165186 RepID=UPI0029312597|nr:preprotein translocase subunit SecE [uncultured Ruminococcus sp.]